MKIDWVRKLSSRKFWAAMVAFAVPIMVVFNVNSITQEQITAIITSTGALIAYILSEGYIDGKRAGASEGESEVHDE